MKILQKSNIILIITLLLFIQSEAENISNSKKTINRNLQGFNQISLKFPETGKFKILNDKNRNIFETDNLHFYYGNPKTEIVKSSFCTKDSDTKTISCTITKTNIQIEISEEISNLKELFYQSEASEIIFEQTWKNTKIKEIEKMCLNAENLKKIDMSNLNTEELISMNSLFSGCVSLNLIDFGDINTSKIKNFDYIFNSCYVLDSINLTNFDTSQATSMSGMFAECYNLYTLDLSNFNTSNVKNMSYMFYYCDYLDSLDLSNFDTKNVIDMSYMFYYCDYLYYLDLSNFDTKNVINMSYMFYYCNYLDVLDVSNFNTINVKNMSYMFYNIYYVTSLDLSSFDTKSVIDMSYMFYENFYLTSLDLSNFNTKNVLDMSGMFCYSPYLYSLNLSNFDTSNVKNMAYMFYYNYYLTSLDISNFNTKNVIDMSYMFYYCDYLTSLDLSHFDTKNVIDMSGMFCFCSSLYSVNVSSFDTSNVKNMSYMFYYCDSLDSLNLSNFDTKNVIDMSVMFSSYYLTSLDLSNFDTSNVKNMSYMFYNFNELTYLNLSNFNTKNVIDMSGMFEDCPYLISLDISNFDTSNVINMSYMFCINNNNNNPSAEPKLRRLSTSLTSLDLSNFNTKNVIDMSYMFSRRLSLVSLDVSKFDTSNVMNMKYMFCYCESLISLDVSKFNTKNVIDMSYMFGGCANLNSLNLSNFDTSSVTNMECMFPGLNLITLNLSNFDTSSVTDMECMFCYCNNLKYLDISNFDTNLVESMEWMFDGCEELISLDLHSFVTSSLSYAYGMFNVYPNLQLINLFNFNALKLDENDNYGDVFQDIDSLIYCKFYKYDDSKQYLFKACSTFLGFQFCPTCKNNNTLDYCIADVCGKELKFLYLSNETKITEPSKKQCYYFKYIDNYEKQYLHPDNVTGNIKCNIEGKYNYNLCKKCNNLLKYYQLEEDNLKNEFDCYNFTEYDILNEKYFINNKNNIDKCDNSCINCIGINTNCTNCTPGYYNLIDNNNSCYNDTTKPDNYYLNLNESIYKHCHIDCKDCIGEPDQNSSNCLSCMDNSKNVVDGNCIIECSDKSCLSCDENFNYSNLCLKCNTNNGYFPLYDQINEKYKNCYKKSENVSKYYFDDKSETFKKCYETCEICESGGDENNHKCSKCIANYFKLNNSDSNCVIKCPYYYYLSDLECPEYRCTEYYLCPSIANLYVIKKSKCINNCTYDEDYKYQYDAYCLEKCPEHTEPNLQLICLDKEEKCVETNNKIELAFEDLSEENIQIIVKNYGQEFNYTDNHITIFNNDDYKLTLYKNYECLRNSNISRINMEACLNINKFDDVIILIITIYRVENTLFLYSVYDAKTYKKIKVTEICKDTINEEKNVLELANNKNKTIIEFLFDQNINVFNSKEPFFNDICFHFNSINGRDVPLKIRIKEYYPNITLCEEECENVGINFTARMAICKCTPKNNIISDIVDNSFVSLDDFNKIEESNIRILKCYKDFFDPYYIKKNFGFFFALFLITIQIICTFLLVIFGMIGTKKFINEVINKIEKLKIRKKKSKSSNDLNNLNSEPPKKTKAKYKKKSGKNLSINSQNENNIINSNQIIVYNSNDKNIENEKSKEILEKEEQKIRKRSKDLTNKTRRRSILINEAKINSVVEENYDDMNYNDMVIKDNRTFCQMYTDKLQDNQDLVNIFAENKLIPKSLKLILLIIKINFYFVVNGLMYNEEYITELYYLEKKETFFSFVSRSVDRIIYTSIVGVVVTFLIDCFFSQEKEIRLIIHEGLENNDEALKKINLNLEKFYRKIKRNYTIFIVISYLISLFSWYYMSCFNNVYPNTKYEWVKSSIVVFIVLQIISICSSLIYSIFRYLSRKMKSERLFKIGQNFD